jgi:hypothetical protein
MLPTAAGANAVEIVQTAAGASVAPQVVTGLVKSAVFGPVRAIPAVLSVSVPGLERVTVCRAVVEPTEVLA